MSEVDPRHVILYYVQCKKCRRYFASLKRYELIQNYTQHLKRHGEGPELPAPIMEREVSLE
ncbi:MAG: hypothetical protein QW815_09290 [Nitrososphaerota archaeon]